MNKETKRVVLIGAALILLVLVSFVFRSREANAPAEESAPAATEETAAEENLYRYEEISTQDLLDRLMKRDEGLVVVDIRPSNQYRREHILRSVNLPIQTVLSEKTAPRYGKDLVVLVAGDINSDSIAQAAEIFAANNSTVKVLSGGFSVWKSEFRPTISQGDIDSLIDRSKINPIEPEEFIKAIKEKDPTVTIVDVRAPSLYKRSRIVGAVNIPLAELERRAEKDIPTGSVVYLYGDNDLEAFRAGVRLYDLGYLSTRTSSKNFDALVEAGAPTVKGNDRRADSSRPR